MRSLITFLLFIFSYQYYCAETYELQIQKTAERIVEQLYEVKGYKKIAKPKVEVITCSTQCAGARYAKRNNVIVLETKLYEVCRSLGKDSLDALAYVLGHEMGHFYQEDTSSNFLAFNHHAEHKHTETEKLADVHGIFNAYLAGYKVDGLLDRLIPRLYDAYNIVELAGYPTKRERIFTVGEVMYTIKNLIHIYELANYLVAMGKYELAIQHYEYLLKSYKGVELFNNIGVCYLLEAMNFTEEDHDLYIFPIELEADSRIAKPKIEQGTKSLSIEQYRYRRKCLLQAQEYFKLTSKLAPNYIPDDINIMCYYVLMEEPKSAITFYEQKIAPIKPRLNKLNAAKLELALAIAYAQSTNEQDQAMQIWQRLQQYPSMGIVQQAKYNLKITQQIKDQSFQTANNDNPCPLAFERLQPPYLQQTGLGQAIRINNGLKLFINENPKQITYTLKFKDKTHITKLYRSISIANRIQISPNKHFISSSDSYFVYCQKKKKIIVADLNGYIKEWCWEETLHTE